MLSFQEFFQACSGLWITERTYHFMESDEIERSHTEFRVKPLALAEKQQILAVNKPGEPVGAIASNGITVDVAQAMTEDAPCPGFAIAFDTRSETGETVSMALRALFVPDSYVTATTLGPAPVLPLVAEVPPGAPEEVVRGYYLRDEGYSEAGAIAGRFTYQSTRQTLEMTTYYSRSVAVDQMRLIAPDVRLRTIVTYRRPTATEPPSQITLVGFGVEHKQSE